MILHRNVALLRVVDAQALGELRAAVGLDDYVLGEVSPLELVIEPARVQELVSALEARGLTPLVRRVSGDG